MSDGTYIKQGRGALNNIAAATQVVTVPPDSVRGSARLVKVIVTTAGAVGAIYDAANVAGATAANLVFVIPAAVGVYPIDWPIVAGIYVAPGAAQILNVCYD